MTDRFETSWDGRITILFIIPGSFKSEQHVYKLQGFTQKYIEFR